MLVSNLTPDDVFTYFCKIAEIPHGSGNCDELSSYCMNLAKEYGHDVYKDDAGNVMIFAKGTPGYEESEPVILQGHLDMVCDKLPERLIQMDTDPLDLCTDGEYIWADGTTLGGDDGVAIAYILALLTSDSIPHPPIEALLTVDEEVGMIGAQKLDVSRLKGKKLINLDSEEEGILMVSCAGGVRARMAYPYARKEEVPDNNVFYSITLSGLLGGHSGSDIHERRLNAIKLLAQLLKKLGEKFTFSIPAFDGGVKDNAIPKDARAVVCVDPDTLGAMCEEMEYLVDHYKRKYGHLADGLKIAFAPAPRTKTTTTFEETMNMVEFLLDLPDSVWKMSEEMEGKVESSLNLGVARTKEDTISLIYLLRSNASGGKEEMRSALDTYAKKHHTLVEYFADYPAWEYRKESSLRDTLVEIYREQYGKDPVVDSIHAGLECGILSGKMPDVDFISFGPTMYNVHTPQEKLDVASVARTWTFLKNILKHLK